jgi:hypothetical protein
MQKSAHTNPPTRRPPTPAGAALDPKGEKDEPFWSLSVGNDRRSRARLQKADQKR